MRSDVGTFSAGGWDMSGVRNKKTSQKVNSPLWNLAACLLQTNAKFTLLFGTIFNYE